MNELGALTDVLLEKTQADKIDWRVDRDDRIHTFLGKNILEIEIPKYEEFDGGHMILRNIDGIILLQESFGSMEFDTLKKLKKLMEIARRKSLHVNEALSDLKLRLEAL